MEKVQDQAPRDEIAEAPTAARAAALWWAKQVGAPIFRNTGERDSAEDRRNGDFAGMMQTLISSKHPVNEEQGTAFADELERRVEEMLGWTTHGVSLGVDYGPDLKLAEAAQATGISLSRFPWKTNMWIHAQYVTAALGYGTQPKLIWQSTEWVRPQCGSHRYVETRDRYECFNEICPKPMYHDGDHGDWIPDPAVCKECDQPYTYHYGPDSEYRGHIYEPVVKS